jgi:uncharacterized protein (DUF1330 family)
MKMNYKLAAATLVGVLAGAAGITALRAQAPKPALGYVVAEVDVTDPATFKAYGDKAPGTIKQYGGQYIIRGGKVDSLEGDAPKRFVVIRFDSVEKAKAWEDSPEYSAIRPIRQKSAKSRVFIIEGAPQM